MKNLVSAVFIIAILTTAGCTLGTMLSQNPDGGGGHYDFRKTRWGDLKEKVMFNERGIKPQDFGHVLIYKSHLLDIPVNIVYTFDDKKRLRSAGYIVDKPVGGVKHLKEYALKLHGEPSNQSSSEGLGWVDGKTLIYLQLNERVVSLSPFVPTSGPLSHLQQNQSSKVLWWDGVWGYADSEFLESLTHVHQLNHYERLLLGVMRYRTQFIVGDQRIIEAPELR